MQASPARTVREGLREDDTVAGCGGDAVHDVRDALRAGVDVKARLARRPVYFISGIANGIHRVVREWR